MPKIREDRQLTVLQEKFVAAYLTDPNGTRAYKEARGGKCSYLTAHRESIKLLANPTVRAHLKAGMRAVAKAAKVKASRIVEGLNRTANADIKDTVYYDSENNEIPRQLRDIPFKTRMAIKKVSIKIVEKKLQKFTDDSKEEQVAQVETSMVTIELMDKTAAQDKLMKHLGLYMKDNEQKHGIKSQAEADAIRDKLKARGMTFDVVNTPSKN